MFADGDPDAGGHEHFAPVDLERLDGRVHESLGDLGDRTIIRRSGADDGELVPAGARDQIFLPNTAAQAGGELAQQRVAGAVPQGVVDVLESVDVEHQHAHAVPEPAGVAKLGGELACQQRAVRETGEGILQRAAAQLVLGRGAVKRAADHVSHGLHEPCVVHRERTQRRRPVRDDHVATP